MTAVPRGSIAVQHYAYRNVTISGLPGAGSTTLLRLLLEELGVDGWRGFSGGEFMREYAKEQGLLAEGNLHHDATIYNEDFDRQVDLGMRDRLATQEKWILESWLSGFFAQGIDGVLKVLVMCSDEGVRVDRVVNRDNVNIESAKSHIFERTQKNLEKWSQMYKTEWNLWVVESGGVQPQDPIDFWRPDLYDVVIDTYKNSREQTLEIVLSALRSKNSA